MHVYALAGKSGGRRGRHVDSVGVAAGAGCSGRRVSNNTGWLTVTSGASGSGNGTVALQCVGQPTHGAARTGTVAIGGQTFTVNQAAASCTYTLSPRSSVGRRGRHGRQPWRRRRRGLCVDGRQQQHRLADGDERREWQRQWHGGVQRGGQPTAAARTGTVTIAGQTFTVNQAAAPCTYTLSPGSLAVAAGGTSGSVGVAAGAGCIGRRRRARAGSR